MADVERRWAGEQTEGHNIPSFLRIFFEIVILGFFTLCLLIFLLKNIFFARAFIAFVVVFVIFIFSDFV